MKNATATALALLITGCAQQTFTVQNKPAAVANSEGNHHPSFLSVSELGRRKLVDAAKICGYAENVVKTETQQTFVNGLLGLLLLGIYTPLEACVLPYNNCMSCPSIWATLSGTAHYTSGSFQLFLHSDQPLLRVNNPVQRCLPVGGGCIIHAGGGGICRTD